MNQNPISQDDPRLTLYALHEMEPAERAEFEKLLQQDAAAQAAVEEIRAMAVTVTLALENEPSFAEVSEGNSARQAAIIPGPNLRQLDGGPLKEPSKVLRFPQIYFMISGLAAACFAVFFVYWQQHRARHERHSYMSVDLAQAPTVEAESEKKAMEAKANANTEAYAPRKDSDYLRVADQPLSTFSVGVDTASYANVRRFLAQGQRPPPEAVRIEELVNYFPYRYAPPAGNVPFAAHLEVASAPWAPEHRLVRIGLKVREVSDAGGKLTTIAKDVKIQVEFNPAQVLAYRLIGYENRLLAKEDFENDKVDAGEISAGHTVTALYEVVPVGVELPVVEALKYQKTEQGSSFAKATEDRAGSKEQGALKGEMLTVNIRYKEPAGDVSSRLEFPLRDTGARFEDASADFKFAAAVAGFGMALRESPYKGSLTLAAVAGWGRAGLGDDPGGYRNEFLGLVKQAEALGQ